MKRLLTWVGLFALLLEISGQAWAGGTLSPQGYNAWELYVFGNGNVVWNILNSVSAMVNDSGYHDLLEFVGVLGIFGAAIVAGFDASKMPKMLSFTLMAFFVLYVSLDVTANIIVEDPVTGYSNVATGVPAVVGIPAAVISDVGHWLTGKIEQDFSLPNDLTVAGGNAFDLTNALVQDSTEAQIGDPYLRQSMAAYTSNCVMPELANGNLNASTILNSTNLWNTLDVNNNGILTAYYTSADPQGELEGCQQAWTDINGALINYAPTLLSQNANAWQNTGATSFLGDALTSSMAFLTNNTVNSPADQTVLQTASINMLNSSFENSAALSGNNGLMTAMATAQAEQSQTSSWFTAAKIFNDMMGYVYSVLQAFLFAITPILMAALLLPGFGITIIKNLAQVLIWLMLWEPMLAIVNYIISLYGQQSYGGFISSAGGITDSNIPVISAQSAHMVLAAGFLGTMVPIIAWGLVKGSLGFSDFIMAGVSSSFASSAGQSAATGNVTLDNQSANNDSMNSKNYQHSITAGITSFMENNGMANPNVIASYGGAMAETVGGKATKTISQGLSASIGSAGTTSNENSTIVSDAHAITKKVDRTNNWVASHAMAASQGLVARVGIRQGMAIGEAAAKADARGTSGDTSLTGSQNVYNREDASIKAGVGGGVRQAVDDALFGGAAKGAAKGAAEDAAEDATGDAAGLAAKGGSRLGAVPTKAAGAGLLAGYLASSAAAAKAPATIQNAMHRKLTNGQKGFIKGYYDQKMKEIDKLPESERLAAEGTLIALLSVGAVMGVDEIGAMVGASGAAIGEAVTTMDGAGEAAGAAEVAGGETVAADGAADGAAEGAPAEGAPADGAPADGAPADGAPADGAPADGAPADGKAAPKGTPEDNSAKPAEESKSSPGKKKLTPGQKAVLNALGMFVGSMTLGETQGQTTSLDRKTSIKSNANKQTTFNNNVASSLNADTGIEETKAAQQMVNFAVSKGYSGSLAAQNMINEVTNASVKTGYGRSANRSQSATVIKSTTFGRLVGASKINAERLEEERLGSGFNKVNSKAEDEIQNDKEHTNKVNPDNINPKAIQERIDRLIPIVGENAPKNLTKVQEQAELAADAKNLKAGIRELQNMYGAVKTRALVGLAVDYRRANPDPTLQGFQASLSATGYKIKNQSALDLLGIAGDILANGNIPPANMTAPSVAQKKNIEADVAIWSQKMQPYLPALQQAASEYGIPEDILAGVIARESSWKPGAVAYDAAGTPAYGLGQIQPATGESLGFTTEQLKNPVDNIFATAKDLSIELKTKGLVGGLEQYSGTTNNPQEAAVYIRRVEEYSKGLEPVLQRKSIAS